MINKQFIAFRKRRGVEEVCNKRKKNEQWYDDEWTCFSFTIDSKSSLMMKILTMVVMVVLALVVDVVGDDTQAFRDMLSSLCSLNKEGQFGSCCESIDISSVTLASSATRNCFTSSIFSRDGSITALQVF